jgi:hypothetical protein
VPAFCPGTWLAKSTEMKSALITALLALTSIVSYAEPNSEDDPTSNQCLNALKSSALFKDVKRQLKSFTKKDFIEIDKLFRIITADGYELNIQFGMFDENKTSNGFVTIAPYHQRDTPESARTNITPLDSLFISKIWFARDFRQVHLRFGEDNLKQVTIFFKQPFDGKNVKSANIEKIYLKLDSRTDVPTLNGPFNTPKYQPVSITYKGANAAEVMAALNTVPFPINPQAGDALQMREADDSEIENFLKELNISDDEGGIESLLGSVDININEFPELLEFHQAMESDTPDSFNKFDFKKLKLGLNKAIADLKEKDVHPTKIKRIEEIMRPMIEIMESIQKMTKMVGALTPKIPPYEEREGSPKIYRGSLKIYATKQKDPLAFLVEFHPSEQVEVHYILSGLRALGLRHDHPIFQYADKGYFED